MVEKVGIIKNPLTIIAIFAGIAEVSGTVVLPFIAEKNQILFICFLIAFPTLLIILFFLTLNFNNIVLYAPSDYQNEDNYVKQFKYDSNRQEIVAINVPSEEKYDSIFKRIAERDDHLSLKMQDLELRLQNQVTESITELSAKIPSNPNLYSFMVTAELDNSDRFVKNLGAKGFKFELYSSPVIEGDDDLPVEIFSKNHAVIWLGRNIPFDIAQEVISDAKKFYPHLKYIYISNDTRTSISGADDQLYIGGATKSATERFGVGSLDDLDFSKLSAAKNKDDFYSIIRNRYI